MDQRIIARQFHVKGIVQGVGFRPFVYQLARRHGLAGQVANTSAGVTIAVEGPAAAVTAFEHDLSTQAPPLAVITAVETQDLDPEGLQGFDIVTSKVHNLRATLISPDVCVCADCLAELFNPADRRYRYPFINCTNCGPRYTIIEDVPYDRPKTSMRRFAMCPACQAEYDDPANRRFHAQPNACPVCGPQVALWDADGRPVDSTDPIGRAAALLEQGDVVAIKGLGGFHLAVDATNPQAVARLRTRKLREEKPLALMAAGLEQIGAFARFDKNEQALLLSVQRPIVLLAKRQPNPIAVAVAPANPYFGVMLPYTPLHYLLLDHGFAALVMTSANRSDEPICIDNAEALERLADIADGYLVHDRDIYLRSDDSIIRHLDEAPRFVRRSRGYVPVPVFLQKPLPPVLACGAELKNTVCLTRKDQAFVSQHIGDLENLAALDFFKMTIAHLRRILDIRPEAAACDLHPDYLSTVWARQQSDLPVVGVQHHHAHMAACMGEHHLEGPVIGLCLDGTGLGSDGAVWGGEVLVGDFSGFDRAGHLAYTPLPGAAAAIKQPWRMALAHLIGAFGQGWADLDLPLRQHVEAGKLAFVARMVAQRVNCPPTSSLGRLFDAVAAICGLRQSVSFEGQAAMELEMVAAAGKARPYRFDLDESSGVHRILPGSIVAALVGDLLAGTPVAEVSARFHATVIAAFGTVAVKVGRERGLNTVVLSGGAFQNAILLTGLTRFLRDRGLDVFSHTKVPCNDGGLSLGQALVAAARV